MADNRIHINLDAKGNQVISVGTESKTLTDLEVDSLMEALRTGKDDSKAIRASLKTIAGIRKQYNTAGKPVEDVKEIPDESAEKP